MLRRGFLILCLTLLVFLSQVSARSLAGEEADLADLQRRSQSEREFEQTVLKSSNFQTQDIRRYIVTFDESPSTSTVSTMDEKLSKMGGKIVSKFDIIPAVTIDIPAQFISVVEKMPGVAYIEEDQAVQAYKAV